MFIHYYEYLHSAEGLSTREGVWVVLRSALPRNTTGVCPWSRCKCLNLMTYSSEKIGTTQIPTFCVVAGWRLRVGAG